MKHDLNYKEYIDRYLQGEMAPDEKNWFEKEIEGNLSLKQEIRLRKQVDIVLADNNLMELKAQLDLIHNEIFVVSEKGKGTIRKIYRRIYASAGALVIVSILFSVYLSSRNFSNSKLIEDFYKPASASLNFRSANEGQDQLTKAMDFYKGHKYQQAIELFETILKQDSTKIGLNLYSGISHMEIKEYDIASDRFQKIILNQPNPFVESAKWYLGMSYLMTDKRNKAAEQFEVLASTKGFYQNDAQKILKRIK
jgi:tetratricopeptide (TPR) repeat protein